MTLPAVTPNRRAGPAIPVPRARASRTTPVPPIARRRSSAHHQPERPRHPNQTPTTPTDRAVGRHHRIPDHDDPHKRRSARPNRRAPPPRTRRNPPRRPKRSSSSSIWPPTGGAACNPGETCEIRGIGPVPVEVARQWAGDAFIKTVICDGTNIHRVHHFGRTINTHLRTALDLLEPACAVPEM